MATPDTVLIGGDQSQAPMLRAVLSTELTVATVIVGLRFFTRLKLIRSPGTGDWIMLATWVRFMLLDLVNSHACTNSGVNEIPNSIE